MMAKGNPIMEKTMGEDEFKGLEAEIDSAVDRLFVEKQKESEESLIMKPTRLEPSREKEQETSSQSTSISPSKPTSFLRSGEKMETQLLSLEWEITKENLENTKEEVLALQRIMREKPQIKAILDSMEKVLNLMIQDDENISSSLIKFLLDSKETIKLLMKKEKDSEIDIYKQLASAGIEARFSCLKGLKSLETKLPPSGSKEEIDRAEKPMFGGEQIQENLNKMSSFLERMNGVLEKIDTHVSRLGQETGKSFEQPLAGKEPLLINIVVFRVDERLFGVKSDKIFRLFKVPSTFHTKYVGQQKIRLRDFEVRMIDLEGIFSIRGGDRKGPEKILTVKDGGEYKGMLVDEVLKRLSARSDTGGEFGEYFVGMAHWTYQQRPVDIPILDLKKF